MCCPKTWIDILSALATPTLAIFALYIAFRQWRTAELKRQHDLFDRRYGIYQSIVETLSMVGISEDVLDLASIPKMNGLAREARFLFGKDISDYIKSLIPKMSELYVTFNGVLKYNNVPEADRKNMQARVNELQDFLIRESVEIEKRFEKYLIIEEK